MGRSPLSLETAVSEEARTLLEVLSLLDVMLCHAVDDDPDFAGIVGVE